MVVNETRRGFDPEDERFFSDAAVSNLRIAQEEVQWLIDRGYKLDSAVEFVGNHYLLSLRQRLAIKRATATKEQYVKRNTSLLYFEDAKKGCIYIDGFNLIISIEVALYGSVLILGKDGVFRDLAGLRGTYRLIDKTKTALKLTGTVLKELNVPSVKFFLDKPVSNSGRLRAEILKCSVEWGIPTEVELVRNPDSILSGMGRVVTGDSVILDNCKSWLNLSRKIIEYYVEDAWIVHLNNDRCF